MTTINIEQIREELVNVLRNGDIFTTSLRGVNTARYINSALPQQKIINLNQTGIHNIRRFVVAKPANLTYRATGDGQTDTGPATGDYIYTGTQYLGYPVFFNSSAMLYLWVEPTGGYAIISRAVGLIFPSSFEKLIFGTLPPTQPVDFEGHYINKGSPFSGSLDLEIINITEKKLFLDYIIDWKNGIITLNEGLEDKDIFIIDYDYGNTDKIYPDMPREDLTLESFPRVGIELTSINTQPFGLGGMCHISDILLTIFAWVPANKTNNIGGTQYLSDLMSKIRDVIRQNAKSFSTFKYITPIGMGPIIKSTNNKIIQQSMDFSIKFKTEIN